MSDDFKKVFAGHVDAVADVVARQSEAVARLVPDGAWQDDGPIGRPLETPRVIQTRDGVITHVDGVALPGATDE